MIRFLRFHQIWKLIQPPKANTRKAMIKAITTFPPAWNTPKRQDCAQNDQRKQQVQNSQYTIQPTERLAEKTARIDIIEIGSDESKKLAFHRS